ncbi:MAG: BNR repeat-containing protein [Kiritimatiellia bacterium]
MLQRTWGIAFAAMAMIASVMFVSARDMDVMEKIVVDSIWPGTRVGYALLTHGDRQYVAYYDSDRNMAVAQRKRGETEFSKTVLPSRQTWDSHNYITMALDKRGYLHLSGNMHVDNLVYFRSTQPGDASTLQQIPAMVGKQENRVTYPKFMQDPDGNLIFHYRHGGSGNGLEVYNVYDPDTQTWRRLLDQPLISGNGKSNAYMRGPMRGPQGWYHLLWMWRDTPDVATNHDLSYARSRDLLHWQTAAGVPLTLPITPADTSTVVDPVPVKGGLHNSNHHLGFDSKGNVVVTYFKHDESGDTQAYAARPTDGQWVIKQISDWKGRHIFRGGGSGPSTFGTALGLKAPRQHGEGKLALPVHHWLAGQGLLVFDEQTLAPLGTAPERKPYPAALSTVISTFPGMQVNWQSDSGSTPDENSRYVLRWETLGTNRDRPREGPLPESQALVLYKISRQE